MRKKIVSLFKDLKNPKNPALWIILFYCVKGTAVTLPDLGGTHGGLKSKNHNKAARSAYKILTANEHK